MKLTKAPATEWAQHVTAAAAADDDVAVTVGPSNDVNQQVLELLATSYVTIIVVVVVILGLVVGLAVYKSYTTWASARTTTRRRRHSSQHWLTEDNPEMWTDQSLGDGGEHAVG